MQRVGPGGGLTDRKPGSDGIFRCFRSHWTRVTREVGAGRNQPSRFITAVRPMARRARKLIDSLADSEA